ncbi:MAG TPA: hypothetical protein VFV78_13315 [Vicinamibacterales bacterium]|nr:hypothetical protein [Vicinamibacterales bacterium]
MIRTALRFVSLGLVLVPVSGCLKAQAKTPGPQPALTTPEPPARVLIPVPADALAPPPAPVPEPTPPGPPRTTPTPAPKPTVTPTPTPTVTPVPVDTPPPILQTTGDMSRLETQARNSLDRAQRDLDRVKRDSLPPDVKDSYDSAARYIRLARNAMTDKNFLLAKTCADKAATIASLLVKGAAS